MLEDKYYWVCYEITWVYGKREVRNTIIQEHPFVLIGRNKKGSINNSYEFALINYKEISKEEFELYLEECK